MVSRGRVIALCGQRAVVAHLLFTVCRHRRREDSSGFLPALFTCTQIAYVHTHSANDRRSRRIRSIPQPNGCFVGRFKALARKRDGWSGSRTHRQPLGCPQFSRLLGLPNADPSKTKTLQPFGIAGFAKSRLYAEPYNPGILPRSVVPDIRSDPVGRCVVLVVGVETNIAKSPVSESEVYAIIPRLSSDSFIFFEKISSCCSTSSMMPR